MVSQEELKLDQPSGKKTDTNNTLAFMDASMNKTGGNIFSSSIEDLANGLSIAGNSEGNINVQPSYDISPIQMARAG